MITFSSDEVRPTWKSIFLFLPEEIFPVLAELFLCLVKASNHIFPVSTSTKDIILMDTDPTGNAVVPIFEVSKWKFWISGILTCITVCRGVIGNILSIATLLHRKMGNVFSYLLGILCLADLLVTLSSFVHAVKTLSTGPFFLENLVLLNESVSHIAASISIFLTMAITFERYFGVCSAFTYKARVTRRGSLRILCSYVIPAVMAAITLNIPKLLSIGKFFNLDEFSTDQKNAYIKGSITYKMVHLLTTTCIIPNILDSYHRRCRHFITSGRWVADIMIRYTVLLNSSVNFIIYCVAAVRFRAVLVELLRNVSKNSVKYSHILMDINLPAPSQLH